MTGTYDSGILPLTVQLTCLVVYRACFAKEVDCIVYIHTELICQADFRLLGGECTNRLYI